MNARWLRRLISCLLAAFLLCAFALADEEDTAQAPATVHPDAVPALDFTFEDMEGNVHSLSEFYEKPIVLNFWATWCPPCRAEMPGFDEISAQYGEEVEFLMVNLTDGQRDTRESVAAFLEENGFSFPVYLDVNYEGAYGYGVSSIPTTVFMYAGGEVYGLWVGAMQEEDLLFYTEYLIEDVEKQSTGEQ